MTERGAEGWRACGAIVRVGSSSRNRGDLIRVHAEIYDPQVGHLVGIVALVFGAVVSQLSVPIQAPAPQMLNGAILHDGARVATIAISPGRDLQRHQCIRTPPVDGDGRQVRRDVPCSATVVYGRVQAGAAELALFTVAPTLEVAAAQDRTRVRVADSHPRDGDTGAKADGRQGCHRIGCQSYLVPIVVAKPPRTTAAPAFEVAVVEDSTGVAHAGANGDGAAADAKVDRGEAGHNAGAGTVTDVVCVVVPQTTMLALTEALDIAAMEEDAAVLVAGRHGERASPDTEVDGLQAFHVGGQGARRRRRADFVVAEATGSSVAKALQAPER